VENITTILQQVERKYQVKMLYACETGSRAWGFPSPDSDYDIRFLYMHERDWYLSLSDKKDTIEFMLNEELDITGWDLRKSLFLLKKSNAPLIERFQSPIEYYSVPGFKEDFSQLIKEYYSPVAVFYHHYSLAKKFWEEIRAEPTVKLKQYFYLIRSMLSCNWIAENSSLLPMHLEGLMRLINENTRDELRKLVKLKATVGEKYVHPIEKSLNTWLVNLWDKIDSAKENLVANNNNYDALNDFFIQAVNEAANNRLG
jgi:predicted nucleotidyltransferase